MAFARLHLLVADRGVGRDREDQSVDLGLVAPVVVVCADSGSLRPSDRRRNWNGPVPIGAWFSISGVPAASIASAYSLRHDRREIHRHVGDERRFGTGQVEDDGVVVDLLDAFDQIGHRHAAEVFPGAARDRDSRGSLRCPGGRSVKITSSALKSRVGVNMSFEWNLTPWRSLNVYGLAVIRRLPSFRPGPE